MTDPAMLVPAVVTGLLGGALYALLALGLTLGFAVYRVVNLAHGALIGGAMYLVYLAQAQLGLAPLLVMPFIACAWFAGGYLFARYVFGALLARAHDEWRALLLMVGIALIIDNALLVGAGAGARSVSSAGALRMIELGPAVVETGRLVAAGVAVGVALALWLWLRLAATGRAALALARTPAGADTVVEPPVAHVRAVVFGIGTALAAIAACLLAPQFGVNPQAGNGWLMVGLAVIVFAGLGSIVGALAGGFALGVVESLAGSMYGETLARLCIFALVFVMALLRPGGVAGEDARRSRPAARTS